MWKKIGPRIWPMLLSSLIAATLVTVYLKKCGGQNGTIPPEEITKPSDKVPSEDPPETLPEQENTAIIEEACNPPPPIIKEVVKEVEVPVPVIKWKTREVVKWKTRTVEVPVPVERIVYREKSVPQGCNVDWVRGTATASVDKSRNIKCTVNWQRRHVDTKIWDRQMAAPAPRMKSLK